MSVNQSIETGSSRGQSPSNSSSDDDNESVKSESREATPLAGTQYEILRDNGFKHLKNPDLDDQRATQRFLARKGQIGDNHAADNAIIEEITCINFMCHDKLHVKLGPLINFVVGMNGSGKSAVLTAVTLCLGGKASATNRGASLKSLIKGGTDQAILIVKLKNGGSDGYQKDLYGNSIIVERHFSRTGSSGYRLKNEAGRTISTKKGDVDDIIEYYQLQVDNPMNVLTQDAAKSFIQNSTPAQKYKFFVEGVQLQQLDNDYKLVSDICDQIEEKLNDGKKDITALKKKAELAHEKAEFVRQHEDMRRAYGRMGKELAWAQVEEVEANLAERERVVAKAQDDIEEALRVAEEKSLLFQRTEEALERAVEYGKQVEQDGSPLNEEEQVARAAHDTAAAEVQAAHTEQRRIQSSLKDAKNKVASFESDIADEKRRMEDANGGAHTRKLADIEAAKQDVSRAEESLAKNEAEVPTLEAARGAAEKDLEKLNHHVVAKDREIEENRKRLHSLNTDRGNVMAGYDQKMPRLIQTIRNDQRFREQPVGPIGLHIRLLNPSWSSLLESTLGNTLNGFIVTSKADQMRLSGIMRQLNVHMFCPILIGNHHPISTEGHEPDARYETILRVLDIDNVLVKNQLIINLSIEQCLLIRKRVDAHTEMYSGAKPRNVKICYAMHDNRREYGHRLAFSGRQQNGEDMRPVKINVHQAPRMKTDIESQIDMQNEALAQLEREKSDLKSQKNILQQRVNRCKQDIVQSRRTHAQLKLEGQRAGDRVERLQAEYDKLNIEDGRLDALNQHLRDAQQEVTMYEDAYGSQGIEKEKLNEVSAAKKRDLTAVKVRIAEHAAIVQKAQTKVRNTRQARQMSLTEKNIAIEAIVKLDEKKAVLVRKRDAVASQLRTFIGEASDVCERIPVPEGETAASLDAKCMQLKATLKAYNKQQGGTDEEINNAYNEALRVYRTAVTHLTSMTELSALLKQSFMDRIGMYQRFQQFISARSRINFNYLLSERAFRGKLLIDHKSRKLDVHVEPDETTKSSKGRATKTLSGGEKSFSSICLLLALWEAMGAPLRCLDEFDVFMDDVNRDVSSRMIVSNSLSWQHIHINTTQISAARRSVGRQFILITPKALGSGVEIGDDVKIHKLVKPIRIVDVSLLTFSRLTDPRVRGQRTIDEMMEG